ncbi:MAG: WXG100 family type VII secretion target [Coriobacteriales bacterium]|jgi:WXG100 family type VII secretion target|nr:WXG100 family type VII secretion target [Coriobacteriales bacterium]
MAGQIRISPETMRGRAGEYRTEAGNVDNVIQRMDSLLSNLQSEWEGAASESYASRFSELRPGFVKAKELIEEIAASLDKTAQTLEETDANIASAFKG